MGAGSGPVAATAASASATAALASSAAAEEQQQDGTTAGPASSSSTVTAAAATASAGPQLQPRKFDPLGGAGRGKGKSAGSKPASGAAQRGGGGGGGGGGRGAALRPEAVGLEDDLLKLVAEWSQALHPEQGDDPLAAAAAAAGGPRQQQQQQPPPRAGNAVLRALEEQTRRTVADAGLRPAGGEEAGDGGEGAGEGDHVSMIVDVVMQHLLSKDVLYQPMKVRRAHWMGGWVVRARGRVAGHKAP